MAFAYYSCCSSDSSQQVKRAEIIASSPAIMVKISDKKSSEGLSVIDGLGKDDSSHQSVKIKTEQVIKKTSQPTPSERPSTHKQEVPQVFSKKGLPSENNRKLLANQQITTAVQTTFKDKEFSNRYELSAADEHGQSSIPGQISPILVFPKQLGQEQMEATQKKSNEAFFSKCPSASIEGSSMRQHQMASLLQKQEPLDEEADLPSAEELKEGVILGMNLEQQNAPALTEATSERKRPATSALPSPLGATVMEVNSECVSSKRGVEMAQRLEIKTDTKQGFEGGGSVSQRDDTQMKSDAKQLNLEQSSLPASNDVSLRMKKSPLNASTHDRRAPARVRSAQSQKSNKSSSGNLTDKKKLNVRLGRLTKEDSEPKKSSFAKSSHQGNSNHGQATPKFKVQDRLQKSVSIEGSSNGKPKKFVKLPQHQKSGMSFRSKGSEGGDVTASAAPVNLPKKEQSKPLLAKDTPDSQARGSSSYRAQTRHHDAPTATQGRNPRVKEVNTSKLSEGSGTKKPLLHPQSRVANKKKTPCTHHIQHTYQKPKAREAKTGIAAIGSPPEVVNKNPSQEIVKKSLPNPLITPQEIDQKQFNQNLRRESQVPPLVLGDSIQFSMNELEYNNTSAFISLREASNIGELLHPNHPKRLAAQAKREEEEDVGLSDVPLTSPHIPPQRRFHFKITFNDMKQAHPRPPKRVNRKHPDLAGPYFEPLPIIEASISTVKPGMAPSMVITDPNQDNFIPAGPVHLQVKPTCFSQEIQDESHQQQQTSGRRRPASAVQGIHQETDTRPPEKAHATFIQAASKHFDASPSDEIFNITSPNVQQPRVEELKEETVDKLTSARKSSQLHFKFSPVNEVEPGLEQSLIYKNKANLNSEIYEESLDNQTGSRYDVASTFPLDRDKERVAFSSDQGSAREQQPKQKEEHRVQISVPPKEKVVPTLRPDPIVRFTVKPEEARRSKLQTVRKEPELVFEVQPVVLSKQSENTNLSHRHLPTINLLITDRSKVISESMIVSQEVELEEQGIENSSLPSMHGGAGHHFTVEASSKGECAPSHFNQKVNDRLAKESQGEMSEQSRSKMVVPHFEKVPMPCSAEKSTDRKKTGHKFRLALSPGRHFDLESQQHSHVGAVVAEHHLREPDVVDNLDKEEQASIPSTIRQQQEHGFQTINRRTILIKGEDSKWKVARQVHTQMATILKIKACIRHRLAEELAIDSENYINNLFSSLPFQINDPAAGSSPKESFVHEEESPPLSVAGAPPQAPPVIRPVNVPVLKLNHETIFQVSESSMQLEPSYPEQIDLEFDIADLLEDIYQVGTQQAEIADEVNYLLAAIKNRLLTLYEEQLARVVQVPDSATITATQAAEQSEKKPCSGEVKDMLNLIYSKSLKKYEPKLEASEDGKSSIRNSIVEPDQALPQPVAAEASDFAEKEAALERPAARLPPRHESKEAAPISKLPPIPMASSSYIAPQAPGAGATPTNQQAHPQIGFADGASARTILTEQGNHGLAHFTGAAGGSVASGLEQSQEAFLPPAVQIMSPTAIDAENERIKILASQEQQEQAEVEEKKRLIWDKLPAAVLELFKKINAKHRMKEQLGAGILTMVRKTQEQQKIRMQMQDKILEIYSNQERKRKMVVEIQALDDDSIQNDQSLLDHLAEERNTDANQQDFTLSEKQDDDPGLQSQKSLPHTEIFSLAEDELSSRNEGLGQIAEIHETSKETEGFRLPDQQPVFSMMVKTRVLNTSKDTSLDSIISPERPMKIDINPPTIGSIDLQLESIPSVSISEAISPGGAAKKFGYNQDSMLKIQPPTADKADNAGFSTFCKQKTTILPYQSRKNQIFIENVEEDSIVQVKGLLPSSNKASEISPSLRVHQMTSRLRAYLKVGWCFLFSALGGSTRGFEAQQMRTWFLHGLAARRLLEESRFLEATAIFRLEMRLKFFGAKTILVPVQKMPTSTAQGRTTLQIQSPPRPKLIPRRSSGPLDVRVRQTTPKRGWNFSFMATQSFDFSKVPTAPSLGRNKLQVDPHRVQYEILPDPKEVRISQQQRPKHDNFMIDPVRVPEQYVRYKVQDIQQTHGAPLPFNSTTYSRGGMAVPQNRMMQGNRDLFSSQQDAFSNGRMTMTRQESAIGECVDYQSVEEPNHVQRQGDSISINTGHIQDQRTIQPSPNSVEVGRVMPGQLEQIQDQDEQQPSIIHPNQERTWRFTTKRTSAQVNSLEAEKGRIYNFINIQNKNQRDAVVLQGEIGADLAAYNYMTPNPRQIIRDRGGSQGPTLRPANKRSQFHSPSTMRQMKIYKYIKAHCDQQETNERRKKLEEAEKRRKIRNLQIKELKQEKLLYLESEAMRWRELYIQREMQTLKRNFSHGRIQTDQVKTLASTLYSPMHYSLKKIKIRKTRKNKRSTHRRANNSASQEHIKIVAQGRDRSDPASQLPPEQIEQVDQQAHRTPLPTTSMQFEAEKSTNDFKNNDFMYQTLKYKKDGSGLDNGVFIPRKHTYQNRTRAMTAHGRRNTEIEQRTRRANNLSSLMPANV